MSVEEGAIGYEVEGFIRKNIPLVGEDITEILSITPALINIIEKVDIYMRSQEACPFGRGNWLVDISMRKNGKSKVIAIKLPLQMTEEAVLAYAKPLIVALAQKGDNAAEMH